MSNFLGLAIWMTLGGFLLAGTIDHQEKKCPGQGVSEAESAITILLWPGVIAAALASGPITPLRCNP